MTMTYRDPRREQHTANGTYETCTETTRTKTNQSMLQQNSREISDQQSHASLLCPTLRNRHDECGQTNHKRRHLETRAREAKNGMRDLERPRFLEQAPRLPSLSKYQRPHGNKVYRQPHAATPFASVTTRQPFLTMIRQQDTCSQKMCSRLATGRQVGPKSHRCFILIF